MQETWVQSLGQEDAPEKGMATRSSILLGEFHGQRSLEGLQGVGHNWETDTSYSTEPICLASIISANKNV